MKQTHTRQLLITGVVGITTLVGTALLLIALSLAARLGQSGNDSAPVASSSLVAAGGISADAAADLARSHVQGSAVLVSAVAGKYRDAFTIRSTGVTLDQPDRLVWAVTYDAVFDDICPPNGAACFPPRPGQNQVILDYFTGEFLESAAFAPAP
jgi:hypothetical protein